MNNILSKIKIKLNNGAKFMNTRHAINAMKRTMVVETETKNLSCSSKMCWPSVVWPKFIETLQTKVGLAKSIFRVTGNVTK